MQITQNKVSMGVPEYRSSPNSLFFRVSSNQPYSLDTQRYLCLLVPLNPDIDGSILLVNPNDLNEKYQCRINEIVPTLKSALRIRVSMMVERFLKKRFAEFADLLEQAKNNQ